MEEQSQLIMDSYQQNLGHTSRILQVLQEMAGKGEREGGGVLLQDLIDQQGDIVSGAGSGGSVRKRIRKRKE